MNEILRVENLRFSYKTGDPVLKNISFSVASGEFVAVTGASGSGKSTLFYVLGTLAGKFDGKVFFQGQAVHSLSAHECSIFRNQSIGFIFQHFFLLPRATVLENVLLPTFYPHDDSRPSEGDIKKAKQILNELGLGSLMDRKPQELSGGQQQRVAIARALIRDPDVILADEPTGNLDSKSSAAVIEILRDLNRRGKTIIMVTHSDDLADECSRRLVFKDGELVEDRKREAHRIEVKKVDLQVSQETTQPRLQLKPGGSTWPLRSYYRALEPAWANIRRTKAKAALTMLGVVLGIAAVLTTISLGVFARKKIVESYQTLGVNTLQLNGWPNWRGSSRDYSPSVFREFDWDRDVIPIQQIFPEVEFVSPVVASWGDSLNYGGLSFNENTSVVGVTDDYRLITRQSIAQGRPISAIDVEVANPVCVIGDMVRKRLFRAEDPLGNTLKIADSGQSGEYPCRVIGVLHPQPGQGETYQVDNQVFLPVTYLQRSMSNPWQRSIRELRLKIKLGSDPDKLGEQITGYLKSRYGSSGQFNTYSNARVISQMNLFLAVFSTLLTAVAFVALVVGGVGINNMMLVNLSERLKELGLRKALGATPTQIRSLVLTESLVLCALGGVIGIVVGFLGAEGLIYAGSKLLPNAEFEWIFVPSAMLISAGAIVLTGILSGLVPALRAERLDVIECLRQD